MVRSRPGRLLFLLLLFVAGSGMLLVFKVPVYKQVAKRYWRDFRRPDVPAMHTEFVLANGVEVPEDPIPFAAASPTGPNLRFQFPAPGFALTGNTSPAIIRVVKDVADSLVSIAAGVTFSSPEPSLDLRLCMRVDHADGTPVEWNEKRLLASEHRVNVPERFNFEWLLREVTVRHDDRIAVFLCNPGGANVTITSMDVVFRSAGPIRTPATQ